MNKTLKLLLSFLIMIICLGSIFIVIGYQKSIIDNKQLILFEESNNNVFNTPSINLSNIEIIIIFVAVLMFILSLLSIIMHIFRLNYIKVLHYTILKSLIILALSTIITFFITYITNKYILVSKNSEFVKQPYNSYIIRPIGTIQYEEDETIEYKRIYGAETNVNSLLIKSGSTVNLNNSSIYKKGDSSNPMSSRIYGTNSAILVLKDSTLNINNSSITTSSSGSSGLFAVLENSKINANTVTIDTSNKESIGIVASINSSIDANNVKIKTSSSSSPTLSSIRGGVLNVVGGILKSNASGSPLIYTNSIVTLTDSVGDANASQAVYMKDKSTVKINNCDLKVTGNRVQDNNYDGGFVIYDEFLDSNYKESSSLSIYDSNIEIKKQSKVFSKAPMFFVFNNNVNINLSNNNFIYGSDIFLKTINNSDNKTMLVVLNSNSQDINGSIIVSDNTTLELNFTKTNFKGSINSNNDGKKVTLKISEDSTINLTSDSYISVLTDDDSEYSNITSNGYNIYYDPELNENLNNKAIELSDGGKIIPM